MYYYPQLSPQPMYNNYNYNMAGMYNGIPANPIGNIAPLGYGGYNNYGNNYNNMGGYYSGLYNNYNPYLMRQQQELYEAQIREQQRIQADIYTKLYKSACTFNNIPIEQEVIDSFSPQDTEGYLDGLTDEEKNTYYKIKQKEDYLEYHKQNIMRIHNTPYVPYYDYQYVNRVIACQKMAEDYKKLVPDDMSLQEYLQTQGRVDYMEYLKNNQKKQQSDLSKLYNKDDYNSLLNMHKHTLFGQSVFNPDASIDDQEVHLPNIVSEKTKQERRRRFMEALLQGGELR